MSGRKKRKVKSSSVSMVKVNQVANIVPLVLVAAPVVLSHKAEQLVFLPIPIPPAMVEEQAKGAESSLAMVGPAAPPKPHKDKLLNDRVPPRVPVDLAPVNNSGNSSRTGIGGQAGEGNTSLINSNTESMDIIAGNSSIIAGNSAIVGAQIDGTPAINFCSAEVTESCIFISVVASRISRNVIRNDYVVAPMNAGNGEHIKNVQNADLKGSKMGAVRIAEAPVAIYADNVHTGGVPEVNHFDIADWEPQ